MSLENIFNDGKKSYNKQVNCSNCGKLKFPFARELSKNGIDKPAFQDTCLTCATRQILAHPVYDKEYIRIAKRYSEKKEKIIKKKIRIGKL